MYPGLDFAVGWFLDLLSLSRRDRVVQLPRWPGVFVDPKPDGPHGAPADPEKEGHVHVFLLNKSWNILKTRHVERNSLYPNLFKTCILLKGNPTGLKWSSDRSSFHHDILDDHPISGDVTDVASIVLIPFSLSQLLSIWSAGWSAQRNGTSRRKEMSGHIWMKIYILKGPGDEHHHI